MIANQGDSGTGLFADVLSSAVSDVYLNPVRADRADEFESWLRATVVPAVNQHQPEAQGRWQVMRATDEDEGTVTFAFLFDGGDIREWDLEPLLTKALGAESARRSLEEFSEMLGADQYGWSFTTVDLS